LTFRHRLILHYSTCCKLLRDSPISLVLWKDKICVAKSSRSYGNHARERRPPLFCTRPPASWRVSASQAPPCSLCYALWFGPEPTVLLSCLWHAWRVVSRLLVLHNRSVANAVSLGRTKGESQTRLDGAGGDCKAAQARTRDEKRDQTVSLGWGTRPVFASTQISFLWPWLESEMAKSTSSGVFNTSREQSAASGSEICAGNGFLVASKDGHVPV
jgi:hypothetical protein